jgi:hypothetical protein
VHASQIEMVGRVDLHPKALWPQPWASQYTLAPALWAADIGGTNNESQWGRRRSLAVLSLLSAVPLFALGCMVRNHRYIARGHYNPFCGSRHMASFYSENGSQPPVVPNDVRCILRDLECGVTWRTDAFLY